MEINKQIILNLGYLGSVEGTKLKDEEVVKLLSHNPVLDKDKEINLDNGYKIVHLGQETYYVVRNDYRIVVAKLLPNIKDDKVFHWTEKPYGKEDKIYVAKVDPDGNDQCWFDINYHMNGQTFITFRIRTIRGEANASVNRQRLSNATNEKIIETMNGMMEGFKNYFNKLKPIED